MSEKITYRTITRRNIQIIQAGEQIGSITNTKSRGEIDPRVKAFATGPYVWIVRLNTGWELTASSLSHAKLELAAHLNGTPRPWPFDRSVEQFADECAKTLNDLAKSRVQ